MNTNVGTHENIPWRKWEDFYNVSLRYDANKRTAYDNIAKGHDIHYESKIIRAARDAAGDYTDNYGAILKPSSDDFSLSSGADKVVSFGLYYAYTLEDYLVNREVSALDSCTVLKDPQGGDVDWSKITATKYDGSSNWPAFPIRGSGMGTYLPLRISDSSWVSTAAPMYWADFPISLKQYTLCWNTWGGMDTVLTQDDLFDYGLFMEIVNYYHAPNWNVMGFYGYPHFAEFTITPSQLKAYYFNPVVNTISNRQWQDDEDFVMTGLGFKLAESSLDDYSWNATNAWSDRIDEIQFIGQEGQGTFTVSYSDCTYDNTEITIPIAKLPALTDGTYQIYIKKTNNESAQMGNAGAYAGDWRTDSDGLMTADDRFVLMVGTPGVNDPARRDPLFLTKWRFKDADGNTVFRYLSPIDVCAPDTFYDGRIIGVSGLRRALDDNTGLYLMPDMTVEVSNTDFEFSKLLANHMVKNQIVELFHAWSDEPHAWRSHSFIGIVDDVSFKHPTTTFYLKDIFKKYFDKKVPLYRITNDEFPNAHEVAVGQSMPEILGLNYLNETDCKGAVQAHCVDTTTFKYIAARGNLHGVTQVYSDGVLKTNIVDYAVSYDALGYTLITFTADQGSNKITFNCTGYMYDDWNSVNGYVQNPAYIIAFLFAFLAEVPIARLDMVSIDALAAKFEAAGYEESGRLVLQNEKEFEGVLGELLFTYGTKGYPTKEGKFKTEKKDITDFLTAMTIWGQLDVEGQAERKYNYREMINRARAVGDLYPTHDLNLVSKEEEKAKSIEDFETEVEAGSPFEFPWTNSAALIGERLIEELVKRSYGDKRLYITLPMKFFDDLDINTDFRFQDLWGLSLTGAGEAGRYYYISSLDYNPMGQSIDIIAVDLQYLLQAYFIFGDEDELADLWVNATHEMRMYGYMCDENTDQFSDGEPGKILIDENIL